MYSFWSAYPANPGCGAWSLSDFKFDPVIRLIQWWDWSSFFEKKTSNTYSVIHFAECKVRGYKSLKWNYRCSNINWPIEMFVNPVDHWSWRSSVLEEWTLLLLCYSCSLPFLLLFGVDCFSNFMFLVFWCSISSFFLVEMSNFLRLIPQM